jgi:type I restriction enzyme S subunit
MPDNGLPVGWQRSRLGDVAAISRGLTWSTEQETSTPTDGAVPVLRIGNVQRDGFRMDDILYVKGVREAEKVRKSISSRTVVMVGSNGNRDRVGNAFLAGDALDGFLYASFLIGVEPLGGLSERFLAALLRSDVIQSQITESTAGSTGLKNLSLGWLRSLQVEIPSEEEQRRIAEVLDSIDAAIEKTEAVIAATERLRSALLGELLTRGVPGWHTEWKQVPGIGTIPACWEVARLGDIATFASGAAKTTDQLRPWSQATPIPVFGGNGISGYTDTPLLQEPVVVIGRVGQKCGSVHVTAGPAWVTDNALYNRSSPNRVSIEYLGLALRRARLNEIRNRNDLPLLTQAIVHHVFVPCPPPVEQEQILRSLVKVEEALATDVRELDALREVKAVASNALLSGRVRVGGFGG